MIVRSRPMLAGVVPDAPQRAAGVRRGSRDPWRGRRGGGSRIAAAQASRDGGAKDARAMKRPFAWERSLSGRHVVGCADRALHGLGAAPIAASPAPPGSRHSISAAGRSPTGHSPTRSRDGRSLLAARARAGIAVALYLPNTPYHPYRFLRRREGRDPRRSPEPARCRTGAGAQAARQRRAHSRDDQSRQHAVHGAQAPGCRPCGSLIVGEDAVWGPCPAPVMPIRERPDVITFEAFTRDAACPRNGPRSRRTTSLCCNIPAAPPARRRAPCSPMAISQQRSPCTRPGSARS